MTFASPESIGFVKNMSLNVSRESGTVPLHRITRSPRQDFDDLNLYQAGVYKQNLYMLQSMLGSQHIRVLAIAAIAECSKPAQIWCYTPSCEPTR